LNLFKSINCPFYSQTQQICERPYCHFKHPNNSSQSNTNATAASSAANKIIDATVLKSSKLFDFT
jgi:hypothetical protein